MAENFTINFIKEKSLLSFIKQDKRISLLLYSEHGLPSQLFHHKCFSFSLILSYLHLSLSVAYL